MSDDEPDFGPEWQAKHPGPEIIQASADQMLRGLERARLKVASHLCRDCFYSAIVGRLLGEWMQRPGGLDNLRALVDGMADGMAKRDGAPPGHSVH